MNRNQKGFWIATTVVLVIAIIVGITLALVNRNDGKDSDNDNDINVNFIGALIAGISTLILIGTSITMSSTIYQQARYIR